MELSEIRKIPHSVEAEQCVIGAVLVDPSCINQIADKLLPHSFYVEKYAQIYEIIFDMFLENRSIDFVTVLESVVSRGIFDEAEGKRVLYEMTQLVPSTSNVAEYAKIIEEKYSLRRLIEACGEITAMCYEQGLSAAEILDTAESLIYKIMQSKTNTSLTHIREAILQTYDRVHKLALDKNAFSGLQTRYEEIDYMLSGLGKGNLILIAARPGIGKTSFALNIAQNIALGDRDCVIAVFSLEMSNDELAGRMLSSQSGVDSMKLNRGEVSDDDWSSLAAAAGILSKTQIYFDDSAGVTVAQMKTKLRRLKKLDLIIVDYLQLMSGGGRYDSRAAEVGAISRALKLMAKEFDVPVIALSQLNRDIEKTKRPQLSNLRESGAIEQDADSIIFLWKPDEDEDEVKPALSVIKCDVAKNRHGPTGSFDLAWNASITRFTNIAKM